MSFRGKLFLFALIAAIPLSACEKNGDEKKTIVASTLRDVPSIRLNYRYEGDVPAPSTFIQKTPEQKNPLIQKNFDDARVGDILDRTITAPDNQHVAAIYRRMGDLDAEFRIDMYSPQGAMLRHVTPDTLAVHFPDTIVWSPDSANLAFVGMLRLGAFAPTPSPMLDTVDPAAANTTPTPNMPVTANVLTMRSEQIYICDSGGDGVRALTQNEKLIYFYYAWSPDSSVLVALAATHREWQILKTQSDAAGEVFRPMGRPRLVEKNGRERMLDDGLTRTHPVFSPDSSKVAAAFDKQIRIYDAIGFQPTQAGIPLVNHLKFSSAQYDKETEKKLAQGETNTNIAASVTPTPLPEASIDPNTLPDEKLLVSYLPIVEMDWEADDILYFETGLVKRMLKETDNLNSYMRWHRVVISAQASAISGSTK